jgi:hypothetical protein
LAGGDFIRPSLTKPRYGRLSAAAKSLLSKNDKTDQPHNTQKIIAESLGMSTGKVARV